MSNSPQNNSSPRNWYQTIGCKGRIAIVASLLLLTSWSLSLAAILSIRLTDRSHVSLTGGAICIFIFSDNGMIWRPRSVYCPPQRVFRPLERLQLNWFSSKPIWQLRNGPLIRPTKRPTRPIGKEVLIPLWPFVLIPFVAFAVQFARRPRPIPGHCKHCGYNLKVNTSGDCPECGCCVTEAPTEMLQ